MATYSYNSTSRSRTFFRNKPLYTGGRSLNGSKWGWEDGSEWGDVPEHLPKDLEDSAPRDTCLVIYPDDYFGAGIGREPTGDAFVFPPLDCHKDRLPFVCQKPAYGD